METPVSTVSVVRIDTVIIHDTVIIIQYVPDSAYAKKIRARYEKSLYGYTVAEVAQAIGLNYHALSLLKYLEEYHPDLALDYEFIKQRADIASRHAEEYVRAHGSTDALTQREADNTDEFSLIHRLVRSSDAG